MYTMPRNFGLVSTFVLCQLQVVRILVVMNYLTFDHWICGSHLVGVNAFIFVHAPACRPCATSREIWNNKGKLPRKIWRQDAIFSLCPFVLWWFKWHVTKKVKKCSSKAESARLGFRGWLLQSDFFLFLSFPFQFVEVFNEPLINMHSFAHSSSLAGYLR